MKNWVKQNGYYLSASGILIFVIIGVCVCQIWKIPLDDQVIERPSYGESEKVIQFYVEDQEGEEASVALTIQPKQYTEEEARKRIQDCYEALLSYVIGDNPDSRHISGNLILSAPEGYEDMNVMIYPSDTEYISTEGELLSENLRSESTETSLYISIACGTLQEQYELPLILLKTENSSNLDAQTYLNKLEEDTFQQSKLELPSLINGKRYSYYTKVDSSSVLGIGAILLAGLFALWYRKRAQIKEENKLRREQLEYDYPELLSKFLIYLKAGMSVRKTWQKLVEDYNKQKKKKGKRYIYEEMAITLHEIELGLGERQAYLAYGKRCGQQSLIRFGSLLEQNLRKGTSGIMNLLEAERIQALEHRKQEIKAAGEVAGIKLMMPMMVLFTLVMMIIMVPSFMSFGL